MLKRREFPTLIANWNDFILTNEVVVMFSKVAQFDVRRHLLRNLLDIANNACAYAYDQVGAGERGGEKVEIGGREEEGRGKSWYGVGNSPQFREQNIFRAEVSNVRHEVLDQYFKKSRPHCQKNAPHQDFYICLHGLAGKVNNYWVIGYSNTLFAPPARQNGKIHL